VAVAQDLEHARARERETALAVAFPNPIARTIDDRLQPRLAAPQHVFGKILRAHGLGLAERAPNRGHEAAQIVLENVVDGAALQCLDRALFADRAGHENERRRGSDLLGDPQRRETIEAGQREIAENDVRRELRDAPAKAALVRGDAANGFETVLREPAGDELRVQRVVLDLQNANALRELRRGARAIGHAATSSCGASRRATPSIGKRSMKRVPLPISDSKSIVPLWCSTTMRCAIASP